MNNTSVTQDTGLSHACMNSTVSLSMITCSMKHGLEENSNITINTVRKNKKNTTTNTIVYNKGYYYKYYKK